MTREEDFTNVAPADEPFARERDPEYATDTVWENPTQADVVLDLHVGTTPVYGSAEQKARITASWGPQEFKGIRRFVVKAKSKARIPSEFDQGIQQTRCLEAQCAFQPTICRNPRHRMAVIGGLGPQLINRRKIQLRQVVSALVVEPAPLAAPPTPGQVPTSDAGTAALARAAARRSTR
jgi:hypothetical protein